MDFEHTPIASRREAFLADSYFQFNFIDNFSIARMYPFVGQISIIK